MMQFISLLNLFILAPMPVFSWNQAGHIVVGEIAYNMVSLETKNKIDSLVLPAFEYMRDAVEKYIQDDVPRFSEFAIASVLPDKFSWSGLNKYFEQFNATVPQDMKKFFYVSHCIHSAYNADSCENPKIKNAPHVKDFLAELTALVSNVNASNHTKAAALVFVSHLVADYHQPLHVVGRMDSNCKHDRGGIKFYTSSPKDGKCSGKKNLHVVFDSIYFNKSGEIEESIMKVKEEHPLFCFRKEQVCDLSLETWIRESNQFAPFIYSATEGEPLSLEYIDKAKEILGERLALASYRLAVTLENIFDGDQSLCESFAQNPVCFNTDSFNDLFCNVRDFFFG